MTRRRILSREGINDEPGALCDSFVACSKPHAGYYLAYIRPPSLMSLCSDVGNCLRGSNLSGRERQIGVLTVVRFWDANCTWAVQMHASLAEGVDQGTIDAINERRDPGLTDPREKLTHEIATQLAGAHRLTEETYAAAEKLFEEEDLVSLISVIGYFCMVAITAYVIDATPSDEAPARLV